MVTREGSAGDEQGKKEKASPTVGYKEDHAISSCLHLHVAERTNVITPECSSYL